MNARPLALVLTASIQPPPARARAPAHRASLPPVVHAQLASRLDGVVSRLETQAKMNMVNKNMAGIVKNLEKSLDDLNLEQVAANMEKFERQFEDLDVQTEFVDQAMSNTTAHTTPPEQVARLMQEIADEHDLEFSAALPEAGKAAAEAEAEAAAADEEKADELESRMAALRQRS